MEPPHIRDDESTGLKQYSIHTITQYGSGRKEKHLVTAVKFIPPPAQSSGQTTVHRGETLRTAAVVLLSPCMYNRTRCLPFTPKALLVHFPSPKGLNRAMHEPASRVFGLAPLLTFRKSTSGCWDASCSYLGATILQGPHHEAVKSTCSAQNVGGGGGGGGGGATLRTRATSC